MTLASRACVWCAVLGVFVWYGGRSGAAGADVVTTNAAAVSGAATSSQAQVCVMQIMASGEVLSVFVDHPTHPDIAVLVPPATTTNVPVSCQDLTSIGLAVANQEASPVNVQITVFTHQGTALCTRGPFTLSENGGRGVVFGSDCVDTGIGGTNFVYTNNEVVDGNTISAFAVAANGVLTEISGSPFPTGGTGSGGGFIATNRIIINVVGNFLYVSNSASNDVSAFSINPATGALTPVPGSPFPTGRSGGSGISLAVTPDGQFLMAGNGGSHNITVFSIAPDGALTPIPGSPFHVDTEPDGMKVSPDGHFLAVALPYFQKGAGAVAMFSIAANGRLTSIAGSPFLDGGTGNAAGIDMNCANNRLFAGEAGDQTIVDVFSIAANGALTPLPDSPFGFGRGHNSNVVLLSPDDQWLFVSNQDSHSVTVFDVAPDGSLTRVPGSPFSVGGQAYATWGMATNRDGTLLYTTNGPNLIGVFEVGPDGMLTAVPGSPFSTGQSGGFLVSLAAFPSKTCAMKMNED
jgi:6-phosphogluconolactonase